jgi:hypothetical protein
MAPQYLKPDIILVTGPEIAKIAPQKSIAQNVKGGED